MADAADTKYAGLPGIVYDQPDVYETSDLPEAEQQQPYEDSSTAVEVLNITAAEAHARFKGKYVDTTYVDFSDRLGYKRRNGYGTSRVEWEMAARGEEETIMQRFQRLQCEVNSLAQDVQAIKEDVIPCADGQTSSVELAKQVEALHSTLQDLRLEDTLGPDYLVPEPQVALQKKLITLVEKLKLSADAPEKTSKDKAADASSAVYELFYAPEHAKLNQLSRVATLEKKIDILESLLGNNPEKLSILSAHTNHKSVLGAVTALSSRLSLLDPGHLDHIEGRLHQVHTRMNQIQEKKQAIEDADKQSKISELYESMKKTEALCSSVPAVMERLMALEGLHEQAMQFSSTLKQLDIAQTRLNGMLQNNGDLLNSLQEKFPQNIEILQKNLDALDKRVQTLKK